MQLCIEKCFLVLISSYLNIPWEKYAQNSLTVKMKILQILKDHRTITLLPSKLKTTVVSSPTQTCEAEFSHQLFQSSLRCQHWCMRLKSCGSAVTLASPCRSWTGSRPVVWSDCPGKSKLLGSHSCWGRPGSTRWGARFFATMERHSSDPPSRAASQLWWLWKCWRGARTPQRPRW